MLGNQQINVLDSVTKNILSKLTNFCWISHFLMISKFTGWIHQHYRQGNSNVSGILLSQLKLQGDSMHRYLCCLF
jgi:hypothetical protein